MVDIRSKKSNFSRNVTTLASGTLLAQLIPILASPILTRIYSPDDFGVFALYISICAVLASVVTGKYELAIMLPKKDTEAVNILALSMCITIIVSLVLCILIIVFHGEIIKLFKNDDIQLWIYFVPLSVLLLGFYTNLVHFNNRAEHYKDIARASIIKSGALSISQIAIGLVKTGSTGLMVGQLISQICANLKLVKNTIQNGNSFKNINKAQIFSQAKRYSEFPKFSLWAGLANSLSQHTIVLLISLYYAPEILGYYALVQRSLAMPSVIIGDAIGKVFFKEAALEKNDTGTSMLSFRSTLIKLTIIGALIFLILFFIIEDLFRVVFGEQWKDAGKYAQILLPLIIIRFVVSPLTRINHVYLKNKNVMLWQIGLFSLYIAIFLVSQKLGYEFLEFLKAITLIISAYYLFHLYLLYSYIRTG